MLEYFMAKIDEIKEFIGLLKVIFIILVAIDTSLIAWTFQYFNSETQLKLYIVNVLIFFISFIIAILFIKILKEIKILRDV